MIRLAKVLKRAWRTSWTTLSTLWTRCLFRVNGVQCSCRLKAIGIPSVNVSIGGKAEIGDSFYVRTGLGTTEVGSVGTRIRVGRNGVLRIGNRVGVSNATIFCQESISIGDDTFIGGGVQIFDTNFHSTDPATRTADPTADVRTAPVSIGSRVFIGANAVICKGVTIGDTAVVAAGSVVVRSVPPGETWGGNPARKIG